MIQIARDLARQFRAVLRKAGAGRQQHPAVELCTGQGKLHIRAALPEVAIEFKQDGPQGEESVLIPFDALVDVEAKSKNPVSFTSVSGGVEALWENGGIPLRKIYAIDNKSRPTMPVVSGKKKASVPGLMQALGHASRVTGTHVRFATDKIQLRGARGEIIASDAAQALIQTGFAFPWKEDVLIPGLPLFDSRELDHVLPATICKSDSNVLIEVGGWTIYLLIDKTSRFPDVASAIPTISANATTCRLGQQDREFLAKSLDKLPGAHEDFSAITVDLNGQVIVRAQDEGQQPTEVVLAESECVGTPVCFHCDRHYLARAIGMNFTELKIVDPSKPIVCKDATRTYVWVPLDKKSAIPPSEKGTRINTQEPTSPNESITQERTAAPMAQTQSNDQHADGAENGTANHDEANGTSNSIGGLIAEAESLRDVLHEIGGRAARLVEANKRNRRQSRLVSTTLASLRQLQEIQA